MKAEPPLWNPWLWPVVATACAGEAALHALRQVFISASPPGPIGPEPAWTTPHSIRLDLPTVRVREFSHGPGGLPTLVVTPFALHGATLADLAPGHSLVERLLAERLTGICVVESKSATASMRFLSIDSYLADLAVVVQDLGGQVNLIGLCQGGWLSLMLAARFPEMICSLVLAGSPIDLDAAPSRLVAGTRATAPAIFEGLVHSGDGLILGSRMLDLWGSAPPDLSTTQQVLQVREDICDDLVERYRQWHQWTINLPGPFYLQVVEQLFRRNELARGEFRALGRVVDLSAIKAPLFLLAGRDDDVTPPPQLLSVHDRVGTPPRQIRTAVAPCGHLSLFLGARTLRHEWRQIAGHMRTLSS
ncbi:alpha/beta fold hydrolase [Microvirga sp. BSC39]|uniref:alpha/beta fold hydrolase n=1 Tax=Microvirga sp. BSC39 TaxID=1549810 RepID=UPI00056CC849|nr:alpha/beta fold hydrolase [Microvirga sp. BSC39]